METKGVTCKIPLDLHNRITEEIRQNESTMSKFIERIILEHYAKGVTTMGKTRTLAFQVSEELFQQIKDYLARYERKLTQKEFVISLIEQALEEADEEFEAAEAAEAEDETETVDANDTADEIEEDDQENEVTDEDEEAEDTQPDDTPEEDTETENAPEPCEVDDADDGSAVDDDADAAARPQWE